MSHVKSWVRLQDLVGESAPVNRILEWLQACDRRESLVTLSRIAADLANSDDGILGATARAWTHDLLVRGVGSEDPIENAVGRAVTSLGPGTAIVHGHVVSVLQMLILAYGSPQGRTTSDARLAFFMLALNDHLQTWPEPPVGLTEHEQVAGAIFYSSIFNHTFDDPLRFIVRSVEIWNRQVGGPINSSEWEQIQLDAFGCTFEEYALSFLIPLYTLSTSWGTSVAPILRRADWVKGQHAERYARWLSEATLSVDAAAWRDVTQPSGLPVLPGQFFRSPLVEIGSGNLLCLSPWHLRDHVTLGTWGKLNEAAKKVFGTRSSQRCCRSLRRA